MKCPNCGAFIPDGKLYCEECGAELQIVEDYDVKLQSEIDNTLNSIAKQHNKKKDEDDIEYDDDSGFFGLAVNGGKGALVFYIILGVILLAGVIGVYAFSNRMKEQSSYEYQLEKANEKLKENEILQALDYMEKAGAIDDSDSDLFFTIANYYYTLGRETDAIYTLTSIAHNEKYSLDVKEEAYRKIITLYESGENYGKIAELLEDCTVDKVVKEFNSYRTQPPYFSKEPAKYDETIKLVIGSDIPGKIYYTVDGTEPTTASELYEGPLSLDYGKYKIKAIFVNAYGVRSDSVGGEYLIDVPFVFEPKVVTEEGTFNHGAYIEVDVPIMYTVYYTTDCTEPFKGSTKYTGKIPMPVGTTTFKFIEYASDGTQSAVVTKTYTLEMEDSISVNHSKNVLLGYLLENGLINEDLKTRNDGKTYSFEYSGVYYLEGVSDYYIFVEYSTDFANNTVKTGAIWAIDCYNGGLYWVDISKDPYGIYPK